MFHEVKVLDSKGKLKKTLNSKELSQQYWKEIDSEANTRKRVSGKEKKTRKKGKKD